MGGGGFQPCSLSLCSLLRRLDETSDSESSIIELILVGFKGNKKAGSEIPVIIE